MTDSIERMLAKRGEVWRLKEVFQLYGWVRPQHFRIDDPDAGEASPDGPSRSLEVRVFVQAGAGQAMAHIYEREEAYGEPSRLTPVQNLSAADLEDAVQRALHAVEMDPQTRQP